MNALRFEISDKDYVEYINSLHDEDEEDDFILFCNEQDERYYDTYFYVQRLMNFYGGNMDNYKIYNPEKDNKYDDYQDLLEENDFILFCYQQDELNETIEEYNDRMKGYFGDGDNDNDTELFHDDFLDSIFPRLAEPGEHHEYENVFIDYDNRY